MKCLSPFWRQKTQNALGAYMWSLYTFSDFVLYSVLSVTIVTITWYQFHFGSFLFNLYFWPNHKPLFRVISAHCPYQELTSHDITHAHFRKCPAAEWHSSWTNIPNVETTRAAKSNKAFWGLRLAIYVIYRSILEETEEKEKKYCFSEQEKENKGNIFWRAKCCPWLWNINQS